MIPQHANLTLERWSQFTFDQQILMIANEMHRGSKALEAADLPRLGLCYERALRLVQLTAETGLRATERRELLRLRDLVAELFLAPGDLDLHYATLSCLLWFTPIAAAQRPFLLPSLKTRPP